MSSFTKALTNKGLALQAKAQSGVQLKYTKFVIGDGRLTGQSMPALTNVISPKKTLPITKLKMRPPNEAIVGSVLSNQDVTTGFYFRELGLYAMDPDEGEILYLYANAGDTADYIPPGSNGTVSYLEAESLDVNVGYGASVDDTQAGASNGKCVKFAYATNGNGKATKSDNTIKNLLGNKAGQYKVRARVKASETTSATPTFILCIQDQVTMAPFKQSKTSNVDSDLAFAPSQMSTDWTWVECPFFWDGVQPIELWTGRPPGTSPGITIWEDQIQFVSENTSGSSDVIEKSFDVLAFVGQSTNVTAIIDQSLVYVTHPELQEAINGVKVVIPDASLTQKGIVQLSNATDGTREDVAATEKAVKTVESNAKTYIDKKPWQKAALTNDAGDAQFSTGTNLNTLVKTGVYSIGSPVNAPANVGSMVYLEVISSSNGYVIQRLSPVAPVGNNPAFYMRTQVASAWGAWSQDLFTSVANGKAEIANAISGKGVPASGSDTFSTLATKIRQIITGKQFASGSITSGGSSSFPDYNGTYVSTPYISFNFANIPFIPSVVELTRTDRAARNFGTIWRRANYYLWGTEYANSSGGAGVSYRIPYSNGVVNIPVDAGGTSYDWVAYE